MRQEKWQNADFTRTTRESIAINTRIFAGHCVWIIDAHPITVGVDNGETHNNHRRRTWARDKKWSAWGTYQTSALVKMLRTYPFLGKDYAVWLRYLVLALCRFLDGRARVVEIKETAHMMHAEKPKEVNKLVLDFLTTSWVTLSALSRTSRDTLMVPPHPVHSLLVADWLRRLKSTRHQCVVVQHDCWKYNT